MQMRRTWRTGVFWPCLSCLFCPAVFFVCPVSLFVLSLCVCVVLSVLLFVFVCLRSRCVLRFFGRCLSVLSCLSCFFYDLMSCCVLRFFLVCLFFFLVLQILVARRWNGHADATYRWNRHADAILAGHASGYLLVTLVLAYLLTGRACWSCWCLVAGCAF